MRTIRYLSLVTLLAAAACGSESNGPSEFDETQGASVSAPRTGGTRGTRVNGPTCEGRPSPLANVVEKPSTDCSR